MYSDSEANVARIGNSRIIPAMENWDSERKWKSTANRIFERGESMQNKKRKKYTDTNEKLK